MKDSSERKKVVIVVMSGNMLLNFSGPSDIFTTANSCLKEAGKPERYDVIIASPPWIEKYRQIQA